MSNPTRVTPELLRQIPLPWPQADIDKDSRGKVLVAGASACSPGAVMLSGLAALRVGAGKVLLAVPHSLSIPIAIALPEAGVHEFAETGGGDPARAACYQISELVGRVDTALIGPGLMDEPAAQALARGVLERADGSGFVIDAMSITGLWDAQRVLARHTGKLVITPHAGEMAPDRAFNVGLSAMSDCKSPTSASPDGSSDGMPAAKSSAGEFVYADGHTTRLSLEPLHVPK